MVRLAIVGVRGWGLHLVRAIEAASASCRCRLVAAAEKRWSDAPDVAADLARRGAVLYDDAAEMFAALRGRCDGVYIATGIDSHARLAMAAMRSGFHVHLEKPPAATVQDVDAMLAVQQQTGRLCLVGFQALHGADAAFVQRQIASGRLGRVRTLVCTGGWRRESAYYTRAPWAGRLHLGGTWVLDGAATNAFAHQVANLLLLAEPTPGRLAEPVRVRAELYAGHPIEGHDTAAIEIRTAGGVRAYLLATHLPERDFDPFIRVEAQHGRIDWDYAKGAVVRRDDGTRRSCPPDPHKLAKEIANFVRAVRTGDGSILRCDLAEARKAVLAIDGAHESSRRIHRIDPALLRRAPREMSDKNHLYLPGMDGLVADAARKAVLLSQLRPRPPWAVATEYFDLTGYAGFPQRFDAGS